MIEDMEDQVEDLQFQLADLRKWKTLYEARENDIQKLEEKLKNLEIDMTDLLN